MIKNKKILLLEDDFNLGETIKDLLSENGYDVDYVIKGDDAIELTYKNSYDLYIFDINVPDIDGLEILSSLRNAEDKTSTIFMSAMTDLKTVLKGFEVGACDFLKKPFYFEELIIKVNLKLSQNGKKIIYKDLEYFVDEQRLLKNKELVFLGEIGICIFELFIYNINKTILKEELYACMNQPTPNALRFHISNINKLTGLNIKNIRSIGYIVEQS